MDPPYGILKNVEWDSAAWDTQKYKSVFQAVAKVNTRPDYAFAVFGSDRNLGTILQAFEESKYTKVQTIIWYKTNAFGVPAKLSDSRLISAFEVIVIGFMGKRSNCTFNYQASAKARYNVWEFPVVPKSEQVLTLANDLVNPAQKPLTLLRALIARHSLPGSAILDLCSGSGTTAVAAASLGRECVSVEIDEEQSQVIQNRLRTTDYTAKVFATNPDPYSPDVSVEDPAELSDAITTTQELTCRNCKAYVTEDA
jgi:DNA modification methylase